MAKRKKANRIKLRGRLWVEAPGGIALTEAGADLLEQIEALGSLSEAARYEHAPPVSESSRCR